MPAVLLTAVLACIMAPEQDTEELRRCPFSRRVNHSCRDTAVGTIVFACRTRSPCIVEGARALVQRFVRPGESVLIAPFDLGLYPALGLRALHWEIYPLFPASPRLEADEIRRMEERAHAPAILSLVALDNRPDLHYTATHPLISSTCRITSRSASASAPGASRRRDQV
jgi:hypothetical protein